MDPFISTLSLELRSNPFSSSKPFLSNPFSPSRGEGEDEGCSSHPSPLPQGEREIKKVRGQKPFPGMLFPNPRESSETPE